MNIGKAVEALKDGKKVCRNGWYGKHHLTLVDGGLICDGARSKEYISSFVVIHTQDGKVDPWACSQSDLLADDWVLVNDE
ncbi:MAG: DUF2829 domain-containing protein [Candidatus Hodarchaeales archaeon]